MRKVKGVFRNEKWANKILFTIVVAVLVVLVGSWVSLAALLDAVNPFGYGGGYGYGYFQEGHKWFGYHTYTYQPLKDIYGFHPNGSLVKSSTSATVYWIDEGTKRAIRSPVAFESWGFNWGSIITVSSAEIAAYETAANLLMRPGTLVKRFHDPNVYLFGFDDELHLITSPDVFNMLGLRWSDIREITWIELAVYTIDGANPISSSVIPADASLLKGSGPAVYLWEKDWTGPTYATELIRSAVAFESWGFNWGSIWTISDVELGAYLATYPGAAIMAKPGTLIKGSTPAVYVVDNLAVQETTPRATVGAATYLWKKRLIPSPEVFNAKLFLWTDIKTESDAEIAVYTTTSTNVM